MNFLTFKNTIYFLENILFYLNLVYSDLYFIDKVERHMLMV